ncbi:MFS transporter [Candidatus Zinderia endosymbiont of Aphrophora alni]|uniref:MFS transporter n=1 Tax=Candidatus Zinderia endosymbiont of Aphrophora alni TaxID=3077951 RepID=UPI0030CBDA96
MYKSELFYSLLLSLIFALRMFGVFIISPLLPVYISGFTSENNYILIGFSLGVYSLVQCFMQLPFGILSDKYGRKPMIIIGLIIFIIGLIISIFSKNIYILIISRIIQGIGVVSSTLMALLIDLTSKKNYFRVMSIVGFFVGLSFAISLISSNFLFSYVGIAGIFLIIAFLSLISLLLIIFFVPSVPFIAKKKTISLKKIIFNKELFKLNFGVFVLYFSQIFFFIIFPRILSICTNVLEMYFWKLYLPVVILSFLFLLPVFFFGGRLISYKMICNIFIFILFLIQIGFIIFFKFFSDNLNLLALLFLMFMTVFNFIEAFQRSLVSKIAPKSYKGSVMGIYSSFQSFGLFLGGLLGGIYSTFKLKNIIYIYILFSFLTFFWFIFFINIKKISSKKKKKKEKIL